MDEFDEELGEDLEQPPNPCSQHVDTGLLCRGWGRVSSWFLPLFRSLLLLALPFSPYRHDRLHYWKHHGGNGRVDILHTLWYPCLQSLPVPLTGDIARFLFLFLFSFSFVHRWALPFLRYNKLMGKTSHRVTVIRSIARKFSGCESK